jgi:hypothetical protein
MDYQFYRDVTDKALAECEIEAFGDWLSHDLANNHSQITQLLDIIEQLENQQIKREKFRGKDYCLHLNQDEVELEALFVGFADEDALPEGTEFEEPLLVGCGLEDLKHLLLAWQEFVSG